MDYVAATFLVLGFIVLLKVLKVVENAARVIKITNQAVADLRSSKLDDDAKETAMQGHARRLFVLFLLVTVGGIAAIFVPLAVIWGLDRMQLMSLESVLRVTLSWQFIVASTVAVVVLLFAKRSR